MSNLKLSVEVVSAHDLVPKDAQDSSGVYVELHFEGQKCRTTLKEKDLSPVWNESFYFNIVNPRNLHDLTLDAYVYNLNKATNKRSFLGKVSLVAFVPYSDAIVLHYPLEKQRIWSRVKGELGLKVFITDDSHMRSSNPLPTMQSTMNVDPRSDKPISNPFSYERAESRPTFRRLPNSDRRKRNDDASAAAPPPKPNLGSYKMSSGPRSPNIVHNYSGPSPMQPGELSVKETSPYLGGGRIVGGQVIPAERPGNTYNLVEKRQYPFVRQEAEMEGLFNAQAILRQRGEVLSRGVKEMQDEKEALQQQLQMLLMNSVVLEAWLRENEGKKVGSLEEEDAFECTDALSKQMLDCTAADLAIEDVIYSMDKAVQEGAIPFDQYLRSVRLLSREQFFHRATGIKVRAAQLQSSSRKHGC